MANDFKRGIKVYLETSDYGKGIDAMVEATKKYETRLAELTAESKKLTEAGVKSGKAWEDNQRQMKLVETQLKKSKAAEEDYRAKLDQTRKVLNNLSGQTYNDLIKVQKQLQKELKDTTRGTDEHKTKLEQLNRVSKEVSKAQGEMNGSIGSNGSFMSKAANGMNKYLALISTGIAAFTGITMAIGKYRDALLELEDSKANLKALTGLGDEDIDWLTTYAKKLSTTTTELGIRVTASSKEIMDGFTVIGSKRPELLKNKEAMADVTKQALTLAQAGKMDVAVAFDVVTASMNQFNLKAEDSSRIINVIAAGSLEGSAEADNLAGSLKNVGTVADDSNMTLEQTVATLEVLASKQLVGEEAGTKLRGALLKMKDAGVGYVSGAFNMRDAIVEINKKMEEKATAAERDALLQKVFGAENVTAGTILLKNVDAYDKLTVAVTGTNVAVKQAQINSSTTSARWAQAKNEINEIGMKLVQSLNPAMLSGSKLLASFMKLMINHPEIIYTVIAAIGILTATYVANTASKWANIAADKTSLAIASGQRIAVLALAVAKAVLTGNLVRAKIAMSLLNKEMIVNPYVAVVAVIAALTYGLYKLVTAQTSAQKAWADYNVQAETEVRNSEILFNALKKTSAGTDERKRLIDKINSVYGEYLNNQLTEKTTLQDIALAQLSVNNGIREKIGLQMKDRATSEIVEKYTEKQLDKLDHIREVLSRQVGKDMSDVLMDELNAAFKSMPVDKAVELMKGKLLQIGKQTGNTAVVGLQGFVGQYGYLLKEMNTEISVVEERFKGLEKIAPMTILMPNDIHNQKKNKDKPSGETEEEKKARLAAEKERAKEAKRIADSQKKERERLLNDAQLKLDIETKAHTDRLKAAGVFEKDLSKLSEDQLSERTRLEELYYTNLNKIATQSEKQRFEQAKNDAGLNVKDPSKLTGEKLKAYELLVAQHQVNLSRITEDGEKKREDFGKMVDESRLKVLTDFQESGIAALESADLRKQTMLQDALNQQLITEKEYNSEMKRLAADLAAAKLALAEASLKALETVDFKDKDVQQKALTTALAEIERLKAELVKAQGDVVKDKAKGLEKEAKTRAEQMKGIFGDSFSEIENLFTNFYTSLDNLNAGNLKSWQDWGKAIGSVVQSALAVASQVNDEYFAGKAAALEADKQRELTNAGDSAAKRELINKDYAQKELDLKKQQSSSDTNLKVFQAIAAGGLAIVQAFAQLGPIGGAVAALLIGGTTKLQIDTIKKQDAAIQATTLDSSVGGGTETKSTGARVVTQAAEGRWDVIGEDDRKLYRNVPYAGVARTGIVTAPTLMGEVGDELIVDNPTLRNIRMNAPYVLDVIRQNRVPQRASGNFTPLEGGSSTDSTAAAVASNTAVIEANILVMTQLITLLSYLRDNGIDAFVILSQLEKQQALRDKSVKKGSLK